MIVLDWNKRKTYRMRKYIKTYTVDGTEEIHYCNPKRILSENITFRNFTNLHIEKNQMVGCRFENCGKIYLTASEHGHGFCVFRNIKILFCSSKFLLYCNFIECECSDNALIELNKCYLGNCRFEHIRLIGGVYLIRGAGNSWGYGCKFHDITPRYEDQQLSEIQYSSLICGVQFLARRGK